ncbi:aldo/keto reductase [Bacillus sp. CMF21]|uniref:aldo/keto reductase n=1 Tax=Metabacillus dongyingensis TaxID=2874282 RepID=UPI001CBD0D15|nr:aldo/keto reductase [Metabacillus dongyingensis]UAL52222.1 aldo/keto reductase [Metabacillus dongyingensis]UOK58000.1 aldo/keto reductase [Bacillus sp. OVS6]USK28540.1 aldo/keto reductase [Bacillus sp. CMF21]
MKPANLKDSVILSNGVKMPWMGLGVFKVKNGEEAVQSVKAAIKNGYRSVDTAAIYQNEESVGQAIKECGVPREELFITTKLWNSEQGYESTLNAFETSMNKLGLDYLDLYLIHWPGKDKYKETWKAFEKLYKERRVRAIGVSNFQIHHLEDLIAAAEIKPMVNQVEFHPHLTQKDLMAYCTKEEIRLEAWSPLKQGQLLNEPVIEKIAKKYNKSIAQVILRWDLHHEVITIPKSVKEQRIVENADIFDFELTSEEIAEIDGLNQDSRAGSHPDTMSVGFE